MIRNVSARALKRRPSGASPPGESAPAPDRHVSVSGRTELRPTDPEPGRTGYNFTPESPKQPKTPFDSDVRPDPAVLEMQAAAPDGMLTGPVASAQPDTERMMLSDATPLASVSRPRAFTFPAPPAKNLEDPVAFFKYWVRLSPTERMRARIYVYRLWPVTDPTQGLTPEEMREIQEKRARPPDKYIDLPDPNKPFDPKRWEMEILHRYGSGDYSIRLNDTHPKVNATVCQTWIRDLRDLDQYPPVLDIDQIVLSDPSNASYIRWRQTNNLPMPRGVDNPEDPESMGTAAVKEMASLVQDQNKQIIELTKAAAKPAETPATPQAVADKTAIDTMADATRASTRLVADSYQRASEATAKAQDPIAFFEKVMTTADKVVARTAPASTADPMAGFSAAMETFMKFQAVLESKNTMLIQTMQAQIDRLTNPIRPAVAAPAEAAAVSANVRQPSMLQQIKDAIEITKMISGNPAGAEESGGLPKWVPMVIAGGSSIIGGIANAIYNAKLQPGQVPVAPPAAPDLSGELPEGETQPQEDDPMTQAKNLLAELHEPLLKALNEGVGGTQFAANFINYKGAMVYDYLCDQGKGALMQFLQMDPALWQEVIKIPQRFDKFLDEFLDSKRAHSFAKAFRNAGAAPKASAGNAAKARTIVDPATGETLTVATPGMPEN